jgi:P pilus assembly chaperone PapD
MSRLRKAGLALMLLAVLSLPAFPALALLVRPILIELASSGSGASGTLEVINDRNRPVAVEVTVKNLTIPEQGDVAITDSDGSDFQIFPAIAKIPAGGRQIFRVRYIGDPAIAESRLFMFNTAELPVAETPTTTGVSLLYAIQSVVAVRPAKGRPNISLVEVRRATGRDGTKGVDMVFKNDGPAHGYVTKGRLRLSVEGSGWEKTFNAGGLSNVFGLGIVPANARRVMFVPLNDLPETGQISTDFRLAGSR